MPAAKAPTYESLVRDLNRSLKLLLKKPDPDGRSALAVASIARAMVIAMEKMKGGGSEDPFISMSKEQLIEYARGHLGEGGDSKKLKAV